MCRWTDAEAFRPTYQGRETPNMGSSSASASGRTLYPAGWADVVSDMGTCVMTARHWFAKKHLHLDEPKKMWTRPPAPMLRAEPERAAEPVEAGRAEAFQPIKSRGGRRRPRQLTPVAERISRKEGSGPQRRGPDRGSLPARKSVQSQYPYTVSEAFMDDKACASGSSRAHRR